MEQDVVLPSPIYNLPFLSTGVSGVVYIFSNSLVVKAPRGTEEARQDLATELEVYRRLGAHPSFPRLHSVQNGMLVLERHQSSLRERLMQLRQAGHRPSPSQIICWAVQIAQGLQHLHTCGVLQVDIGLHNVLLDSTDNAKICDFAGSSIDGSRPNVCPSLRSEHPTLSTQDPSFLSELFALGSLLYEIETTQVPYHNMDDADVEALYLEEIFPNTDTLILGKIIKKCWKREYFDVGQTIKDLKFVKESLQHDKSIEYWRIGR